MLCGCGHYHLPGTVCGKWWRYPDVQDARECGCTQWWAPTQINPIPPEQNRDPAVTRDAYLERIDDRINWRLTHVSLPVADVKYLFSTIEALQRRWESCNQLLRSAYQITGREMDAPNSTNWDAFRNRLWEELKHNPFAVEASDV